MKAGAVTSGADRVAWRKTVVATAIALAAYALIRALPLSGGSLHYTDFGGAGAGFLEFCAPGSPQFAPVDRVRSPVSLTLEFAGDVRVDQPARLLARLATSSDKPVTWDDLLVVHTEKLHLLIVDASLSDYQHVHPRATSTAGTYEFEFTPRRAGRYRVFADFTPRATGRALYAGASIQVEAGEEMPAVVDESEALTTTVGDVRFQLEVDRRPLRINDDSTLTLRVERVNGTAVVLEEIMGAPAHLVAFDARCSGFAHLHPAPASDPANPSAGALAFNLRLADPGYYRLWAQVKVDGREFFAPFGIRAVP